MSESRAAGGDALAIYAADKLNNSTSLRRAHAEEGDAVEREFKVPLDLKIDVWADDLAMLRDEAPELPFLDGLEAELSALRAERAAPSRLLPQLSRRCSGNAYQNTAKTATVATVVITVAAVPKRTSVISMIAPVIASARKVSPAIAKRLRVEDQLALLLVAEGEPVVGRGRDQQHRRDRRAEQRPEVDVLLEGGDFREVLLERDREQEGEEDLDAGQRHPQLLQQLAEVAIKAFVLGLVTPRVAFGGVASGRGVLHLFTIGQ